MYEFTHIPYQRKFIQPLHTSHGVWEIREGIIVKLRDDQGKVGWGEIAPISWFGSESFTAAREFCEQLPPVIDGERIFQISDRLPACQFGFESALAMVKGDLPLISLVPPILPLFRLSALLPAGEKALSTWSNLWQQGYRTFKWKIDVYPLADELSICQQLLQTLPAEAKLRLDANGGLDFDSASCWLYTCDMHSCMHPNQAKVEFVEQPLPPNEFAAMQTLSDSYATPIALDESIASLQQLQSCYEQGWRGVYVIKPGIIGSPRRLQQICSEYRLDTVFSSCLETVIGRSAAIQLASNMSSLGLDPLGTTQKMRSLGFGVQQWFADDEYLWLKSLWQN